MISDTTAPIGVHIGECVLSERALKSDERAGTQAVHTFTEEVCGFAVD